MTKKTYSETALRIAFWAGFVIGILTSFVALVGIGVVTAIGGAF